MTEEQAIAKATIDALLWYHEDHKFDQDMPGCTREHILSILDDVYEGKVTGGKANRYIGWAQAVLCIEGFVSLRMARELNRKAIKDANG